MQSSRAVIVVLVLAAAGAGFLLWRQKHQAAPAPKPIVQPKTAAPVAPPPPPAPPAAPAIEHPLPPEPSADALPDLDGSDGFFQRMLTELVGKKSVASFLLLDGFARRVVATVNNLDSDTAASQLWPVTRTRGPFEVTGSPADTTIAGSNAARYDAFVHFVDAVDTGRAVALYRRSYPLLQRAYEDLGAPGRYFNDRVVAVIDHLLATPALAEPAKVKRAGGEGAGTIAPSAGAGLYLFVDPTLESRSSGQKILLRMGNANAARLKAKLQDFRSHIARGPGTPR